MYKQYLMTDRSLNYTNRIANFKHTYIHINNVILQNLIDSGMNIAQL